MEQPRKEDSGGNHPGLQKKTQHVFLEQAAIAAGKLFVHKRKQAGEIKVGKQLAAETFYPRLFPKARHRLHDRALKLPDSRFIPLGLGKRHPLAS